MSSILASPPISVQFSHSVVSDSLWPHESQHTRPPCPSPTPRVHSDSRPSSQWCHSAISSCVVPFSSCPQSLPVSESSLMSQLFTWGGQSTGVSALNPFMVTSAPCDYQKTFCQINSWLHELSLHQNPIYWPCPLPLCCGLSELSEVLSPRLHSSFCPK